VLFGRDSADVMLPEMSGALPAIQSTSKL